MENPEFNQHKQKWLSLEYFLRNHTYSISFMICIQKAVVPKSNFLNAFYFINGSKIWFSFCQEGWNHIFNGYKDTEIYMDVCQPGRIISHISLSVKYWKWPTVSCMQIYSPICSTKMSYYKCSQVLSHLNQCLQHKKQYSSIHQHQYFASYGNI